MRSWLWLSSVLVVGFAILLFVRPVGAYNTLVDGWGVDLFELAMGGVCLARYFERPWLHGDSVAKAFPLILGVACLGWALGDVALTIESLGGREAPVPSVADGFYVTFFPLCFVAFAMVIRRGHRGSLMATSLDGVIAGLGASAITAAYVFGAVLRASGGTSLAAATNLAYPVGDLLLLALAVGGLSILPREYRRFLAIAGIAMAANAAGDLFNLLQPDSRAGYVVDALAWPVALLLLAVAACAQPADAWVRPGTAESADSDRTAGFTIPVIGALSAVVVLFSSTIGHGGKVAVVLAAATVLVAGVRLTLTARHAQALNSARFHSLIDNAWDLIVVAESNLEIAFVTPSSARILGYRPHELQGTLLTDLIHPDDCEAIRSTLDRLAEEPVDAGTFEARLRRSDGAWRTIAWTATDLLADPSVRGYVLNGGDVTEARQTSEDLAAARDGALMASKAKSDFLSTMSHEIRTPMNGVIGLTELLLDTALDSDQLELTSGIRVSAENLLVIINDILDFSKIEAGKLDIEETVLNVAEIADDVGRIIAATAHSKGLELLVDIHPDVPALLLGDRVRIQQVLLNLASNAVKFTSVGDVIIRVAVPHDNADRVALRFEVIDMGIGIAEADQARLFRAFSQADSSTTRRFGGTGLGLAICRQLIELMGGNLGLVSTPGHGSTFWFELSLARADVVASVATQTLVGQRALIVDDNATNRKILRQQLQSWGVDTVEAVDGYEAVELVAAATETGEVLDLGVIDLNMPGMDGIELAEVLKADPDSRSMTLFLLSSSGTRMSSAEAHLRGFAASLTKPVRSSELFDCLITNLNSPTPVSAPSHEIASDAERQVPTVGKILLVEDNSINQMVASKVLAKLGYQVEIANHGGDAVAGSRQTLFDAVLMDCQMPEMDGYEATAEIRRFEGAHRHTPIIAMTAAAMDGDRDVCLAAGMDDYITKPVRQEAVADALHRWVTRAGGAEHESAVVADGGVGDPIDTAQIELLRGLDDGDGAVLVEIIDQYLTQAGEYRAEIIRIAERGDSRALERLAHTLRGASVNVGATALADVCAELESRGHGSEPADASSLLDKFDAEFVRAHAALSGLAGRT